MLPTARSSVFHHLYQHNQLDTIFIFIAACDIYLSSLHARCHPPDAQCDQSVDMSRALPHLRSRVKGQCSAILYWHCILVLPCEMGPWPLGVVLTRKSGPKVDLLKLPIKGGPVGCQNTSCANWLCIQWLAVTWGNPLTKWLAKKFTGHGQSY